MLSEMRKYYPRPHFLPKEAEHSHLDYVFMGYQQGAVMHVCIKGFACDINFPETHFFGIDNFSIKLNSFIQ